MTSDLLRHVARTIRREGLIKKGDRVAAAVSGGADSVALARLLHRLAPDFGATLVGLIHVNHQLRGDESDADERFCRELAEQLGVPIDVRRRDVRALARAERISLESAARRARYACFEEAASALGAGLVATGHTEDDQAETVLLRLLRGAASRGLAGIRIRRDRFIRPLLETTRADLRGYLRGLGACWREDESNEDRSILRNRIRHELLPVMINVGPASVRALARLARLSADDEAFLDQAANEKAATLVLSDREGALHAAGLNRLPAALSRRIVRQVAARTAPDVNLSAKDLEAVCRLAGTDKPGGRLDLPGLTVTKTSGQLVFQAGREPRAGSASWMPRELSVPGSVTVPEADVVIEARPARPGDVADRAHGTRVMIPSIPTPLVVRNRRAGDRFQPLGAPGSRKLKDVFVDRKVPRSERDSVPVVTDRHGEIVWVAGVALAERCRIRSSGDDMLILELRKRGAAKT